MADIKQAAKWASEGNSVTRPHLAGWYTADSMEYWTYAGPTGNEPERQLTCGDLLAEDWEIA